MNFKKVILALAALGAMLATSCRNNEEGPITPVNIEVSSDYLEVDSVAGTYTVKLTSNTAWTGEIVVSNPWGDEEKNFENDPWLAITPMEGNAGENPVEITITVKENTSDSVKYQREVIIYFRSERQIYATTTVHQMGGQLKPNGDTGPKPVTVEEFLAAEESNQWYRLSGKVVGLYNTEYGNFNIEDETGSVLVYGLNLDATAGDKTFSQIGIGEGDNVTLVGRRSSYNGTPQVGDAYYAPLKVTVAEFLAAEIDDNQLYELTGVMEGPVNTEYGNFDITDETGSVYVYGLTSTVLLGQSNDKSFSTLGYAEGDNLTIVGTRGDYNGKAEVMGPAYAIRAKGGPSMSVVTGEAVISDDKTTATVEGTYTYTGDAADVTEVGVAYKESSAADFIEVKASGVASPFTITFSVEPDKAYNYYAYAKVGETVYSGETLTFTTSEEAVSVSDIVAAIKDGTLADGGSAAVLGAYMEGIVAANNEGENYYKKLSVVDGSGNEASGIVLYGVTGDYNVGDRIRMSLGNVTYSPYSGLRELTFDSNGPQIEVLESGVSFTVPELSASEFNAGDWQGMYVTVTGLTSTHPEGTTWVENGQTTNRYFSSGDEEVVIRNTGYALWAGEVIMTGVTGNISGAVEIYNGTLQVYPITADDIKDFSAVE